MAKSTIRRIGDIISESDALPPIKSAGEYVNTELVLMDFQSHESQLPGTANQGKLYYVLDVHLVEDDEIFQIRTGAETICRQLEAIDKLTDLPMQIRIEKHANTRMLKLT